MGMDTVILRLYSVWGRVNSYSVINKFSNGCSTIYGDGTQTRDFVYIDDVLSAFYNASKWDPAIYNIGTGEETSIEALWELLGNGKKPKFVNYSDGYSEMYRCCADIGYINQETEWGPKVLLSELGKEEVVELCHGN